MSPDRFAASILLPNLADLEAEVGIPINFGAAQFLLTVALHESDCARRYQRSRLLPAGRARGWWNFNRSSELRFVMHSARSRAKARTWTEHCDVDWDEHAIWRALEGHDALAVGFARLLLLTDIFPLPETSGEAWHCYAVRLWRTNRGRQRLWPQHWTLAGHVLQSLRPQGNQRAGMEDAA